MRKLDLLLNGQVWLQTPERILCLWSAVIHFNITIPAGLQLSSQFSYKTSHKLNSQCCSWALPCGVCSWLLPFCFGLSPLTDSLFRFAISLFCWWDFHLTRDGYCASFCLTDTPLCIFLLYWYFIYSKDELKSLINSSQKSGGSL